MDPESQLLTTFITPFGQFKFLCALHGLLFISKHYNCCMDKASVTLSGYGRVVNDIVIYNSDATAHSHHVRQFLKGCTDQGKTFNPDKWQFAQTKVTLARFTLSNEGYRVKPSITEGMSNFPAPANCTDLHSFIRLANELSASTDSIVTMLSPL